MRLVSALLIACSASALLAASETKAQASPQAPPTLILRIKPGPMSEAAGRGFIDITLEVPQFVAAAGRPALSMEIVTSNTESVARRVEILKASDDRGEFVLGVRDDPESASFSRHWIAPRALSGKLRVSYRAPFDNRPPARGSGSPVMLRIDGDGVSGVGSKFIMLPETDTSYRIAVKWDLSQMAPTASASSSFGDGDVDLPVGSIDRLDRTLFMAGTMGRSPVTPVRGFSSAWLGKLPFDPVPLMGWTEQLHSWMSAKFRAPPGDPYRVFLRYNPINAGGGTALINSFFTTYNATTEPDSIKSTLAHEMIHTYTVASVGRWYNEGVAVFYQGLLPWRAGLFTADEFIADVNSTAVRYYSNALSALPDDQIMPRFWEDTRIRTLAYDRGGMYFVVLDAKIRRASRGARSVDDLIQAMNDRNKAKKSVDLQAWLNLVSADLGPKGVAFTRSMLAGALMLPESGDFGPCFRRTTKTVRRFELGFEPKSLVGEVKTIRGLKPGSEAAKAGLLDGDVVTLSQALDTVQGETGMHILLSVTRNGRTFPVSYLPRGETVDVYQWDRVPGVPDASCKI